MYSCTDEASSTYRLSLTPDVAIFARLTLTPSLSRELTLGSDTGVFLVAGPNVWNSLPDSTATV